MPAPDTNHDPATIALQALVWTLAEPARASRLLDVTGLTAADLKQSAGDRTTLSALLGFLENHEPDLIACAEGLDLKPEALVAAHRALEA
jgi:hypothetical protein